ncbi:MAG: GGDEF-domain containing protein, partial [Actinomycetes bacterium]
MALVVGAAFLVVLAVAPLSPFGAVVVDDLAQLVAATTAATLCWAAARGCRSPRERRAWLFMALATGSWALGQAVWTWYELALRDSVPFPSVADVGFLAFPVFAVAALLCMQPSGRDATGRWRDVLDGVGMAGALGIVAWGTSLGSVYEAGAESHLALVLGLAYPVGDVVVVTVVLLTLSRAVTFPRACLALLAAGVSSLAVADTCYVYLTSVGSYASGDVADAGWVAGFLLVAASAVHARLRNGDETAPLSPPSLGSALPYLPLLAAMVVLAAGAVSGGRAPAVETLCVLLLMVLVL